jgi:O-antigen/teichoic acid export membrane protein
MAGLQRLDIGNMVRAGVITVYLGGGIILLVLTHSMIIYMIWNAVTSISGVVIYVVIAQRLVKAVSLRPRFSLDAIRRVWRASLQLGLIAIFTIIFTQLDRVFISHLLPVKLFGFYAAAYTIIMGISFLQGFITSAFMPALAADYGRGDLITMRTRYYKLTQILVYLIGLFAFVGIFFGHDLLLLWTTPETAAGAYRSLALLMFGTLLNASMTSGYIICVVTDNLRFATRINFGVVWIYIPVLYLLTSTLGIEGAALTYVLLNVYYVASFAILIQRYILKDRLMIWFTRTLIPFFALGLVFCIGYLLAQQFDNLLLRWLIYAANVVVYLVLGFGVLDRSIKASIIRPVLHFTATLRKTHDT